MDSKSNPSHWQLAAFIVVKPIAIIGVFVAIFLGVSMGSDFVQWMVTELHNQALSR